MIGAAVGLSKILGACWGFTYLALALGSPKFQSMVDPSLASDASGGNPLLVGGGGVGTRKRCRGMVGFVRHRLGAIRSSACRRPCPRPHNPGRRQQQLNYAGNSPSRKMDTRAGREDGCQGLAIRSRTSGQAGQTAVVASVVGGGGGGGIGGAGRKLLKSREAKLNHHSVFSFTK